MDQMDCLKKNANNLDVLVDVISDVTANNLDVLGVK